MQVACTINYGRKGLWKETTEFQGCQKVKASILASSTKPRDSRAFPHVIYSLGFVSRFLYNSALRLPAICAATRTLASPPFPLGYSVAYEVVPLRHTLEGDAHQSHEGESMPERHAGRGIKLCFAAVALLVLVLLAYEGAFDSLVQALSDIAYDIMRAVNRE